LSFDFGDITWHPIQEYQTLFPTTPPIRITLIVMLKNIYFSYFKAYKFFNDIILFHLSFSNTSIYLVKKALQFIHLPINQINLVISKIVSIST
jgi:hypothetical protein